MRFMPSLQQRRCATAAAPTILALPVSCPLLRAAPASGTRVVIHIPVDSKYTLLSRDHCSAQVQLRLLQDAVT